MQVSAVFFGIAVVFIPIGAACLAASAGVSFAGFASIGFNCRCVSNCGLQVVEISTRYDDTCISGDTYSQRDTNLVQVCQKSDNRPIRYTATAA